MAAVGISTCEGGFIKIAIVGILHFTGCHKATTLATFTVNVIDNAFVAISIFDYPPTTSSCKYSRGCHCNNHCQQNEQILLHNDFLVIHCLFRFLGFKAVITKKTWESVLLLIPRTGSRIAFAKDKQRS